MLLAVFGFHLVGFDFFINVPFGGVRFLYQFDFSISVFFDFFISVSIKPVRFLYISIYRFLYQCFCCKFQSCASCHLKKKAKKELYNISGKYQQKPWSLWKICSLLLYGLYGLPIYLFCFCSNLQSASLWSLWKIMNVNYGLYGKFAVYFLSFSLLR